MHNAQIAGRALVVACGVLVAPGYQAAGPPLAVRPQGTAAQSRSAAVTPFRISVPDAVLTDLKERLARTRFPEEIDGSGWDYGTNLAYLKELVTYWRDTFDWRAAERRLNQFDQFTTNIDGLEIHFVHQRSRNAGALPLVLTHG